VACAKVSFEIKVIMLFCRNLAIISKSYLALLLIVEHLVIVDGLNIVNNFLLGESFKKKAV